MELNLLFLILPEILYLKPKTELTNYVVGFNKYWIFHFVTSEPEITGNFILIFIKKALETKAVWSKHNESSQQKVFWKVGVLIFWFFFPEILEKHQRIIFFFHIAASWRATLLIQRLLKSQVVAKCFNLILS